MKHVRNLIMFSTGMAHIIISIPFLFIYGIVGKKEPFKTFIESLPDLED
jgi:hypothetical protein